MPHLLPISNHASASLFWKTYWSYRFPNISARDLLARVAEEPVELYDVTGVASSEGITRGTARCCSGCSSARDLLARANPRHIMESHRLLGHPSEKNTREA